MDEHAKPRLSPPLEALLRVGLWLRLSERRHNRQQRYNDRIDISIALQGLDTPLTLKYSRDLSVVTPRGVRTRGCRVRTLAKHVLAWWRRRVHMSMNAARKSACATRRLRANAPSSASSSANPPATTRAPPQ